MPEMNGYEVCQHLKADETLRGIPVIFISALNENLDKVKAFALGGVDYITKPFQMEELHARVETHLKLRRLQVELEETNSRLERVNGRMSRDLEAAAKIQKTFLPSRRTSHPGHRVRLVLPALRRTGRRWAEHYSAGRREGWPLHSGCQRPWRLVGPAVGDAQPSPLAAVRPFLDSDPGSRRLDVSKSRRPREVADRLNRLFPYDTATEQFATLMYGVLDVSTGDFRYVSAGHPGPIHLPAAGPPVILASPGFPIGLAEEPYEERCIHLKAGDRLYLYSDGFPMR